MPHTDHTHRLDIDLIPAHTGTTPFGTCYQQCVANLAAWYGLPDAEDVLVTTWGFGWDGGSVLRDGDRWVTAAARLYGLPLRERRFGSYEELRALEKAELAAGRPLAAAVDAYWLPSEYEGVEHLAHCVLLTGRDADGVTIVDPMNRPEPVRYPEERWRTLRSADAADGFRTFLLSGGPTRKPSAHDLARAVSEDRRTHHERDTAALAAYIEACDAAEAGTLDVSGAAAERHFLGRLLRHLADELPQLEPVAVEAASLTRRWYLVHTLSRESGGSPEGRRRLVRMLRDLQGREERLAAHVDEAVAALGA
ncbi:MULTISPECIES: BtrH N-terminal domain-containing protein [Streptomyces]|uniref:BtrH N-terminal domain-containing protein n=1 Tax=Streptomyces TaxID=1883 RepID=UPI00163C47D5|nr:MULTISPECIES: BtrH N-terminal domain-containing protein [Streptomyces]MBC2877344.1 BtrH N-terminal domain-containing protein [Streptomyces sp. TYQ1024]UBI38149.1 BtrH N-terminal domain-containing protein [Streptomyces mobaraensis]UKW30735.1 BtrH N-terminal domain-containing protein [Streptomyces sp. TYQ1024]